MNEAHSPPALRKPRKKRGGQKGNRNARKHGFYSTSLGPEEICRFWDLVNRKSVDPEVAVLTIKLRFLLQNAPHNRRALEEAARLLVKSVSAKYRLNKTNTRRLRKVIIDLLDRAATAWAIYRSDHPEATDG